LAIGAASGGGSDRRGNMVGDGRRRFAVMSIADAERAPRADNPVPATEGGRLRVQGRNEIMAIRTTVSAIMMAGAMCCSANAQSPKSDPLPRAKPEEVGLSSERLADIAKTLDADIARGQIPGAVLAVARHGKLAYFEAFGFRDKAASAPMTPTPSSTSPP
jgi:hypothetical protein